MHDKDGKWCCCLDWNGMQNTYTQLWFILSISLEWSLSLSQLSNCGNDFGMRIILFPFRARVCASMLLLFLSFSRQFSKNSTAYTWSCCCFCCTMLLLLIFYGIANSAFYARIYRMCYYGAYNQHCKRKWTWMPLFFPSIVKHTHTHTHVNLQVKHATIWPSFTSEPNSFIYEYFYAISILSCLDFFSIFNIFVSPYTFTCICKDVYLIIAIKNV